MLRTLSAAFQSWHSSVMLLQQHKALAAKVVRRMSNALDMAFVTWQEFTERSVRSKGSIDTVLKRIMNRTLAAAWTSWDDWLAASRRKKALMARGIGRFKHKAMSAAAAEKKKPIHIFG